jgi:spectrin beta
LQNADLATVKRLLRKHDAFERDLEALGDRVKELDQKCERLIEEHPDQAGELYDSQVKIQKAWTGLVRLSNEKKINLLDAFDYQQFLANYRDLKLWVETKMVQVTIDELAQDEPSLDALIERNQVKEPLFKYIIIIS